MANEISQRQEGHPQGEPAGLAPELELVPELEPEVPQPRELTLPFVRTRWQRLVAATRGALGPVLSKAGAAGGKRLYRSGVRSRRVVAKQVRPALARPGRKALRRLRWSSLRKDHKRLLRALHAVLDRSADSLFFVRTRGHVSRIGLKIPSQVRQTAHDYKPTPRLVFEWALSAVEPPLERTTFIDYGAGRGRVLLLASHHPFASIVGAEIAAELHDDCLMNIAQYPRSLMKCRNIDCQQVHAATLPIPEGPAVFYFFNPFDAGIVLNILNRIERSYKRRRRQMHLICIDMSDLAVAESHGIFQPVEFSLKQQVKHRLFSPYTIQVYRTEP